MDSYDVPYWYMEHGMLHEIVRCKDCKYGKGISDDLEIIYDHFPKLREEFTRDKGTIYCGLHKQYWNENDFCSYGERKE